MSLAENMEPTLRFESAEAFLAWAELQPERWELWDGVARMMSGGSPSHSRLSRNALIAIDRGLGVGPCQAYGSDAAVRLGTGRVAYPDVSVSCGEDTDSGLAPPVVVIEVLSPSTASYDLGQKASAYRRLPSLRHLVFVHQDRIGVEHFHRAAVDHEFSFTEIDSVDGVLILSAVGVEVGMAELYARVAFGG